MHSEGSVGDKNQISPSSMALPRSTIISGVGDVSSKGYVGKRWRELQGSNNWDGLLSPLDLDLRKEILRYGDLEQVTMDAFPWEKKSRYPYACPYKKKEMLDKVGQPDTGYEVTRHLYSYLRGNKSTIQEVNFIGYVAVTVNPEEIKRLGRRDILVAWRGTKTDVEWQQDTLITPIPITSINGKEVPKDVKVVEGFWSAFSDRNVDKPFLDKGSAGKQSTQEVKRLIQKYAGEEMSITCVGNSLGGALATYCAYQIAEDGINKTLSGAKIPVTAFTFASPRAGTTAFRDRFNSLGVKHLRIKTNQDLVPRLPFGNDDASTPVLDVAKEQAIQTMSLTRIIDPFGLLVSKLKEAQKSDEYTHVGTPLSLDFTKSSYLKQPSQPVDLNSAESISNHHNLQAYLHLVNGIVGTDNDLNKPFKLMVVRDLALINKYRDLLVDPYAKNVPAKWWREKNAGLVRNDQSFWVYPFLFDPDQGSDVDYD